MPLFVVNVANRGRWWQHKGVRGVVIHMVEEEGPRCCTHLSGSDPTWGGQWGEEEWRGVDGITWQTLSGGEGGGGGAARATATTTMATGEGG